MNMTISVFYLAKKGRHITSLNQLRMNVNSRNGENIKLLDKPA